MSLARRSEISCHPGCEKQHSGGREKEPSDQCKRHLDPCCSDIGIGEFQNNCELRGRSTSIGGLFVVRKLRGNALRFVHWNSFRLLNQIINKWLKKWRWLRERIQDQIHAVKHDERQQRYDYCKRPADRLGTKYFSR